MEKKNGFMNVLDLEGLIEISHQELELVLHGSINQKVFAYIKKLYLIIIIMAVPRIVKEEKNPKILRAFLEYTINLVNLRRRNLLSFA